jgi:hypothetical protein
LTLKQIYSSSWDNYIYSHQRKLWLEKKHFEAVMKTINCRTARMGMAKYSCESCNHEHFIYRSCKHRFCPTCGTVDTYNWADKTLQFLLNIKHHHVVVTLPKALRFLSKLNGNRIHDLLFQSSASILLDWFNYKYNIKPGIVSVLHTAGADLKYHPHVHLIVTGGGLHMPSKTIQELPNAYLTRQRFLANKFKQQFCRQLLKIHQAEPLNFPKIWEDKPNRLNDFLNKVKKQQWIVSIQKPLADLSQIVGYVGRYTKRTCLSEYKLISHENDVVSFEYNDYKNTPRGHKPLKSVCRLPTFGFLDHLLQHVPDKRYRMVRYMGLYNSHHKKHIPKQEQPTTQTDSKNDEEWIEFEQYRKLEMEHDKQDPLQCPNCKTMMTFDGFVYPYKQLIDDG